MVCVCAALLLSGADRLTRNQIEQQEALAGSAGLKALLPGADHFEPVAPEENRHGLDSLTAALDETGEVLGYVGQTTVTGYGGPIEVTAAVDREGAITGVAVGGDDFDETPGLGALTREAKFTGQFAGRGTDLALNQDGLDAVAGATISSRSVISAVNAITKAVCTDQLGLLEEAAESYVGQLTFASEKGFAGDVTANVGLNDEGVIEYLSIDTPDETDGLGKLCSEPEFTGQFIGKTGPFAFGEDGVEAVSGATFTSTAALNAINTVVSGGGTKGDAPVSATVQGFGGDVTVTASLNPDNSIAALAVDTPNETDGLGKLCSEPEFTGQFVGKCAPFAFGENDIDAVTGATVTSTAVLNALNAILPGGEAAPAAAISQPAPAPTSAVGAPAETEAPAEPEVTAEPQAPAPEVEEPGAVDDVSRLMRARPAFAAASAAAAETPAEEAESGSDASRLMRARPAFAAADAAAAETPAEEAESGSDASRLMRERPVFEMPEVEGEISEANTPEESPEPEAPTEGAEADASRLMRERPAFEAPIEGVEADASRLMRERPAFAQARS